MANYTKTTDFAAKDTLPGGDTNKVVRGSEFETEFDAISTAIATKSDTAGPTFTGTVTIPTADINGGNIDGTAIGSSSASTGNFTTLSINGTAVTSTAAELNILDGVTATAAEINLLDGVTSTTAELNILDGVTATASELNALDGITASTAELNILAGVTSSTAEINLLDGVTASTTEINHLDGVTSNIQTQLNAIGTDGLPTQTGKSGYYLTTNGTSASWDNLKASPTFTGTVTFSGTGATTLPVGTTAQRPTAAQGMVRFNTTTNGFEGYNGSAWGALGAEFAYTRTSATATASQTTFSATYTAGYVDVYLNGVKLVSGTDFTATNGTSVVLTTGATLGDSVEILAYETFSVANALVAGNNLSDLSSAATALTNLGITSTAAELNILDGVTSTAAELNILDGVTATAAELNALDGITATVSELNLLDGVTATTAELNYVDGVTSNIQTQIDNINPSPTLSATASGALANGDTVIINANGTVSAAGESTTYTPSFGTEVVFESATSYRGSIAYDANAQKVVIIYGDGGNSYYGTAIVGTVSGTSISFGTPTVFNSGNTSNTTIVYDANAQKVVVAYRDNSNSNKGTAVVGTVSGTSISFGSETVFEDAATQFISSAYDSTAQKVVLAYEDEGNSDYGTAIVGTISGTSISFGSATVFESGSMRETSTAYDANANRIVVAYVDSGNSSYGTAAVGTVSGTSISFGTPVVFESAGISNTSAVYDANAQKVVISYKDAGNSNYGTAIVGTVSGTSISFGSAAVFNSGSTTEISSAYDSTGQKVVVTYNDAGNSNYGTAIVGTVSGTSISFGSEAVFASSSGEYYSVAYDANANKIVANYADYGNSDYGTAVVGATFSVTTNVTAENYIGISDAAYSDGATATIQIVGSVDDAQSSLTPGQAYYVQNDGSLGTTADTPSVFAGTAVAATKIIVKG